MNYFSSVLLGLCIVCVLLTGCRLDEIDPATVADFEVVDGTSQLQGSLVRFSNTSEYVVPESRFVWKFGDGTDTTVTNTDPVTHRYQDLGSFTVELLAYNKVGHEDKKDTKINIIEDMSATAPIAAFEVDKDVCTAPCSIRFTDASEDHVPSKNVWVISYNGTEDSSFVSAEKSFMLNFSEEGTYIVSLTVENESEQTASTKDTLRIEGSNPLAIARFEIEKDACQAPCEVTLINTSENGVRFEWDFMNDGTVDERTNDLSEVPFYTETWGEIPVKLVAYNVDSVMSDPFLMTVTIDTPNLPISLFRIENNFCFAACQPVIKTFSSYADSFYISYADGQFWTGNRNEIPDDNIFPINYEYEDPGEYLITLIAYQRGKPYSDTLSQTITVRDPSLMPIADFEVVNGGCIASCTVSFNDQSSNATQYMWTFGDGSTSTEQNPSHTYTQAGHYEVILTVMDDQGGSAEKRDTVTIRSDEPTYMKTLGDGDLQRIWSAAAHPNGGFMMVGLTREAGTQYGWLVRINEGGDTMMTRKYRDCMTCNTNQFRSIHETPDGNFIIGGYYQNSSQTGWVVKIDTTGSVIWQLPITLQGSERVQEIFPNPLGGYIAVGRSACQGCNEKNGLLAEITDGGSLGNVIAVGDTSSGSFYDGFFNAAYVTASGIAYLGGHAKQNNSNDDWDAWAVKYDMTSHMILQDTLFGSTSLNEDIWDVTENTSGNLVFCGNQNDGDTINDPIMQFVWTVELDPTFGIQTEGSFQGLTSNLTNAYSIIQTASGSYAMTGYEDSGNEASRELLLLVIDNNMGNSLLKNEFGSPTNSGLDWGKIILPTAQGGYFMGGHTSSQGNGSEDGLYIRTDILGLIQ